MWPQDNTPHCWLVAIKYKQAHQCTCTIYLFSFATKAGTSPQHTPITVGPYHFTFPLGGNWRTRRKPTTFSKALTYSFQFSHEDWFRVRLWDALLRIYLRLQTRRASGLTTLLPKPLYDNSSQALRHVM